ncbi:MAG: class I SAM-dependent methyltransferase [Candidatus Eremiobacteraeota bacterium]|nr:class I SAM-dependent methyltransferase [Candidatus Eremiobacteraeota bacterium]
MKSATSTSCFQKIYSNCLGILFLLIFIICMPSCSRTTNQPADSNIDSVKERETSVKSAEPVAAPLKPIKPVTQEITGSIAPGKVDSPPLADKFPRNVEDALAEQEFPILAPLEPDEYPDLTLDEIEYVKFMKALINKSRVINFNPRRIMDVIELKKGDVIADIGCGPGYLTFQFANKVGKSGKVYAVDIEPMALKYIVLQAKKLKKDRGIEFTNIKLIDNSKSGGNDIMIPPNSLDIAFLCGVHNLAVIPHRYNNILTEKQLKDKNLLHKLIKKENMEFMMNIHKALKTGGKIVIIEARKLEPGDRTGVFFEEDIKKLLKEFGFTFYKSPDDFRSIFVLVMKKK